MKAGGNKEQPPISAVSQTKRGFSVLYALQNAEIGPQPNG